MIKTYSEAIVDKHIRIHIKNGFVEYAFGSGPVEYSTYYKMRRMVAKCKREHPTALILPIADNYSTDIGSWAIVYRDDLRQYPDAYGTCYITNTGRVIGVRMSKYKHLWYVGYMDTNVGKAYVNYHGYNSPNPEFAQQDLDNLAKSKGWKYLI